MRPRAASGRDRMRSARDIVSWILVVAGIAILLFAILWWTLAVKRLVLFPSGVEQDVRCEGVVEKVAGKHGLAPLSPPVEERLELSGKLISVDDEYTRGTAVLEQDIAQTSGAGSGLDMSGSNTYVIDRGDCANKKSDLSTSCGVVVDRSGSWSVNFPLGTSMESYNVFDNDVASSFAMRFVKEDRIEGIGVYTFSGSFRHRPMAGYRAEAMGLPSTTTFGELKDELEAMGIPLDRLLAEAYPTLTSREKEAINEFPDHRELGLEYTAKRHLELSVEPVTGTVVDVRESETFIYVNTDVKVFLPLLEILAAHSEDPMVLQYMSQIDQQNVLEPREIFRVSYHWTPGSSLEMVDYANSRIGPVRFVRDVVTVMMLVLGAASLVAGLVLRRDRYSRGEGGGGGSPAAGGNAVDKG